jgi:hypothetical protein
MNVCLFEKFFLFLMAGITEVFSCFRKKPAERRGMRLMTGSAFTFCNRGMDAHPFIEPFFFILMALITYVSQGISQKMGMG